jgi:hypothetical protein
MYVRDSPYVILNDFGGAFAMGAIGGGIWHGIKGARNSPRVSYSSKSSKLYDDLPPALSKTPSFKANPVFPLPRETDL